ncbi:MAG TPA: tetratricopeptide repeat protein [Gemmataceae bacterium]
MLESAIQLRRRGRFPEAVKLLKASLQRIPDQAAVCWYLGSIYLHDLNQAEQALPLYRRATRSAPKSQRASLGLFHALWALDRRREAMKELGRFQAIAHCDDYATILAEVQKKAPELLGKTVKPKAS